MCLLQPGATVRWEQLSAAPALPLADTGVRGAGVWQALAGVAGSFVWLWRKF